MGKVPALVVDLRTVLQPSLLRVTCSHCDSMWFPWDDASSSCEEDLVVGSTRAIVCPNTCTRSNGLLQTCQLAHVGFLPCRRGCSHAGSSATAATASKVLRGQDRDDVHDIAWKL